MENLRMTYRIGLLASAMLTWFGSDLALAAESRSAVSAGEKAPAFEARTVDGKTIHFPDDYKGKVVLLDFWATWCGPCRRELPNVVATYEQYHSKGFEILSVSLDQPREGPNVVKFTQENKMSWPQIYDGQYWKAAVAVKYGVHAIPCPILVDGDTGVVLAEGPAALGHKLPPALEKALAGKSAK
jgi:thiol-disulfide isomerase/thioredoxin